MSLDTSETVICVMSFLFTVTLLKSPVLHSCAQTANYFLHLLFLCRQAGYHLATLNQATQWHNTYYDEITVKGVLVYNYPALSEGKEELDLVSSDIN